METIRVAIIEPVGGHGGMDYYDIGLCQGLAQAGVDAYLFTCDETTIDPVKTINAKLFYKQIYGNKPNWLRGLRYLGGSLRSFLFAKKINVNLCHLHFFHVGPLEFINVLLCKALNLPLVITVHDVEPFYESFFAHRFAKISYSLANGIIVHNQASQNEIIKKYDFLKEKTTIIPHGNYIHAIDSVPPTQEARETLGLSSHQKVLLFFGQIKAVKGLDTLLVALSIVVQKQKNIILLIAGRIWKDNFENYQRIIDKYGLEDHCRLFIQYIPHEMVSTFFAAADLVVLPYKKIYQSGVLLMSMSYGKPILASDLDGMNQVIIDNNNGFLFPANDSELLALKINEIISNPQKANEVAQQGLELMKEKHDWSQIGKLTKDKYHSVLPNHFQK